MAQYWPDVLRVLDVLAYTVKRSDPDGVEIYFAINHSHVTEKHTTNLVEIARQNRPDASGSPVLSDMGARLDSILEEYRTKLDVYQNQVQSPKRSRFFSRRRAFPGELRKMSLYILTDGAWQPKSNAEDPIRTLVTKLEKFEKSRNQVGIQFIQFGNDEAGGKLLTHLDNGLHLDRFASE
jgi:hypothetical protein